MEASSQTWTDEKSKIYECLCNFDVEDVLCTLHDIWQFRGDYYSNPDSLNVEALFNALRKYDNNCPHSFE